MEVKLLNPTFLAEEIARTGSQQFDEKSRRLYVGIFDEETNWFIPLEGKLSQKAPRDGTFPTPFPNNNPHLKNPGLNLQKSVYITDRNNLLDIRNTMPKAQFNYINDHISNVEKQLKDYTKRIVQLPNYSANVVMSTVPFYPDGIEKLIGQKVDLFGLEGPVINYDPNIELNLSSFENVEIDEFEQSEFGEFEDPYNFHQGREF